MSHSHKKRAYPQIPLGYTQNGGPAISHSRTASYGHQSAPQTPNIQQPSDTFTPIQQQLQGQLDQASTSLGNLHLHNVPIIDPNASSYLQQSQVQVPPSPSLSYTNGSTPFEDKLMNQLYPTDLLRELPPPIHDLTLPPPPIMIPPEEMMVQYEESNSAIDYVRSTLNAVPKNGGLLKKSKLPLALIIRPYQYLHDNVHPPPLNTDGIIVRCRRCRAYMNPYASFIPQTRRWRCNFCRLANDLPMQFNKEFYTDSTEMINRFDRNEVKHSVMEYLAPKEYSVRQPPPSVYTFILDVSINSIKNGALYASTSTLLDSIDKIPNHDGRTKIAIICVDHVIHYFKIPNDESESDTVTMLDVGDLDEPYLPRPDKLLVSLSDCKKNIESLLSRLPLIFQSNTSNSFALGSALKSAYNLISTVGGKIIVQSSTLPNAGIAKLEKRNERAVLNTYRESNLLLNCQDPFYKSFTIECSKAQITIDLFLTANDYIDVATLSNLSRYSGGQLHYYPNFSANDVTKFSREFSKHVSMDISIETVMRARGSRGIKMSSFYGHFFNRSSDLCAFSTMPRDQSYVFEMEIDDNINTNYVYVQIAVLLSANTGERRIRIITLALPTTNSLHELFASADQQAIHAYFTQQAIKRANDVSTIEARDYLKKTIQDILTVYEKEMVVKNVAGGLPLSFCANLRMLPLLMSSLTKNMAFRDAIIPIDQRAAALNYLETLPLKYLTKCIYPSVYPLLEAPEQGDTELLPEPVNSSMKLWQQYGLYLIDNTTELYLWIGGEAVNALVEDLFGVSSVLEVPMGKMELPVIESSELNCKVRNIIGRIRERVDMEQVTYQELYIVRGISTNETANLPYFKEGIALRSMVMAQLVEDNISKTESYREFLQNIKQRMNK
ncbi:hypothetical protein KAFR_0J01510 [Kazachstania africana CBS 2517]|uniref:Protein transport protein SEC24 n=1 Tax=Kazachstania africana (strain ATCC 22294 / BCRC 22015 / CBS 2517 / CECT 1963 / NBRC 1671 / NRRL Y-8276) TaxID=1071382 RepID=H2B0R7_KAZAF|nr:hypothetical protein KAFR_0J01510 [Kazachstania africana CBS 2517]CCF60217.1 hypothetical protein KAFR_0J01510 [Kazachstania africana CBS 2517]